MNPTRCALALALIGGLHGAGCKKDQETAAKPAEPVAGSSPAAATPAADPGNTSIQAVGASGQEKVIATGKKTVADTDSYTITLAAPSTMTPGGDGLATLEVTPKQGWHLNKEFPTKLTVAVGNPGGATVQKPEQSLKDAMAWDEQRGAFQVGFQVKSSGEQTFTGNLKFAVCTASSCDPKKQQVVWAVAVK
jgi:hypothetical protein